MATDPDAIWRPDYAGPDPIRAEPRRFADVLERPLDRAASADRPVGHRSTPDPDDGATGRSCGSTPGVDDAPIASAPRSLPTAELDLGSDQHEEAPTDASGSGRTRRLATIGAAVVVALVAAAVVVADAVDRADEPGAAGIVEEIRQFGRNAMVSSTAPADLPARPAPLDGTGGEPFTGADPRRLPEEITALWTQPLDAPTAEDSSVYVVGDERVVVVSGAPGAGSGDVSETSVLEVFDVATGDSEWSVPLPARPGAFDVVGVVGGVVLVGSSLSDRRLVGHDLAGGTELWVHAEAPGQFDVIGEASGFEVVAGTPLVSRVPVDPDAPTLLFDPATGENVGRLEGEVIGYDGVGAWHTDIAGSITTHDLSEGWSAGRPLGSIWSPTGRGDVVDGRIVQPDRGRIFITEADSVGITIAVVDSETNGIDVPSTVSTATAMAGPTLLLSGAGDVVGAEIVGNVIRPAWRRTGVVQSVHPTLRGHLLLLATRGGAQMEIVDGRTGSTLFALTLAAGSLQSLVVVGNGFVSRRMSQLGPRMAGIDLDGTERWSLPGSEPVAVGDGVVARVEAGDDGPILAVYAAP